MPNSLPTVLSPALSHCLPARPLTCLLAATVSLASTAALATQATNCNDRFAELTRVSAFKDSGPARLQLLQCLLNEQHQLKHNQPFDLAWDEEGILGLQMNFPMSLFAWRRKLPPADSDEEETTSMPVLFSDNADSGATIGDSGGGDVTSGGTYGGGITGTLGTKYACTCGNGIDYVYQPKTGVPDFSKYEVDDPQLYVRIPVDQLGSIGSIDAARLVQAQTNVAQSYNTLAREPYDAGYMRYIMTGTTTEPVTITYGTNPMIAAATKSTTGASAIAWAADPCGCKTPDYQPVTGVPASTKYEIENALRGLDNIEVEALFPGNRIGFDGTVRFVIKE